MQTEKQRERLVELIKNADNDKNLGWYDLYDLCDKKGGCAEYFADYLMSNNVVVLPFPVGTTYYRIVTKRGKVGNPYFKLIRRAELNWYNVENVLSDFGTTVFLTREEAEAKLKEMQNGD